MRRLVSFLFLVACTESTVTHIRAPDAGDLADMDASVPDGGGSATDVATATPDGAMPAPPLRNDVTQSVGWRDAVEVVIDSTSLGASFAERGYTLPTGSAVYGVRITPGASYPAYEFFDAGGGAFDMSFWPASTIKLLAALAALEWVHMQGYTGAARVDWDSGFGDQLRAIYQRSIGVSSNIDYDRTLRAAGWDFTNATFLTPERGFGRTVITSSYASVEVRNPGGYTLTENGQSTYVPGRPGTGEYGRNDTDLFELVEGVRRLTLHDELPEAERFRIDPADVVEVRDALCGATPSYFANGATAALGGTPQICHKPGWVPDNECLDHGLVVAPDGSRYLIAASVPYATNCPQLSIVAEHLLTFLAQAPPRLPLQPDVGDVVIQIDADVVQVEAPGADEAELWLDAERVGRVAGPGRFAFQAAVPPAALVTVIGYAGGQPTSFRSGR